MRRGPKRIEVQGFGQQYVDAAGATLGQVTINGNDVSRYITFSVTKASLGTPASGWGFTVVLARPGRLQLRPGARLPADPAGVPVRRLRDRRRDPHCNADPNTVPKAMDTLTAPTELDYTIAPPALTQVTIP